MARLDTYLEDDYPFYFISLFMNGTAFTNSVIATGEITLPTNSMLSTFNNPTIHIRIVHFG